MFVSQRPGAFQELGEAGCCFKDAGAAHDSGQGGGTSTAAQGPFLSGSPEAHLLVFSPLLLAHKQGGGDLLKVTRLEAPPPQAGAGASASCSPAKPGAVGAALVGPQAAHPARPAPRLPGPLSRLRVPRSLTTLGGVGRR